MTGAEIGDWLDVGEGSVVEVAEGWVKRGGTGGGEEGGGLEWGFSCDFGEENIMDIERNGKRGLRIEKLNLY